MSNLALTGSWGKETFGRPPSPSIPKSTSSEMYDMAPKLHAAEMEQNKFAKFTKMQKTGQMILSPKTEAYIEPRNEDSDDKDRFMTTQQEPYGARTKEAYVTTMRRVKNGEIPPAVGRSGTRQERGIAASGLLGEKLCLSEEPSRNTFVQRTWLYDDDKALHYKVAGIPQATDVTENSLIVGTNTLTESEKLEQIMNDTQKSYGRKSCDLRMNPIAKTGYKIFSDDQNAPPSDLSYHYKV
mmetsp:Transcript_20366/g.29248  ORF Transcript_20366/g.29248 Transcript_20366/m.29248 type:complete len:240 (+) Transcript_20366:131-850(+)|eukprot:CAMPEP_0185026160 /NCGR_PEP_ID=MMETSP1103-20130426/10128_1 /TAXON_ID=36769 /ORGANISM="Paraphysomonas bandaiensis, Strain Caron Lab Isolate" /LENGTH=239 /DNA_ID=CAMNT_0027559651 /DNA_START=42 /DNA_END=761 /DNA_ORIENTATION=+